MKLSKHPFYFLLVLIACLSVACGLGTPAPTATPTTDPATPAAQTAEAAALAASQTAEAAARSTGTAEAQSVATATQAAVEAATATATAQIAATAAAEATAIANKTATAEAAHITSTAAAAIKLTKTAEAKAQATAQAEPISLLAQQLVSDGLLTSAEGSYKQIDDFDESWAQLGWYMYWDTGVSPKNFVLTANTTWESASDRADWWYSGCGFVFREQDNDNHYMIYLALDGRVYLIGFIKGAYRDIDSGYYGTVDLPKGSAKVTLVVQDDLIIYYVNDKQVLRTRHASLDHGGLNLTLSSGTNAGFGTSCQIEDIELWTLK